MANESLSAAKAAKNECPRGISNILRIQPHALCPYCHYPTILKQLWRV